MTADLVSVVENAYRLDLSLHDWLRGIADAMQPRFDRGMGVYAFGFDVSTPDGFVIHDVVGLEGTTVVSELVSKWHSLLGPTELNRMYRSPRVCAPISWRLGVEPGASHVAMDRLCSGVGVRDQLTLRAVDPTLEGISVCTPTARALDVSDSENHGWGLVATHIAAGYRLRRALADSTVLDAADAVLRPDGSIEDANGEAAEVSCRERLRHAVRSIDRARSRRGRESALEVWEGLVDGRWSLVDHFDTDGRRYVVARRNAPGVCDPRGLSSRERQVAGYAALGHANKEIAYSLGLAVSTISSTLTQIRRKLGVASRVELVRMLQPYATALQLREIDDSSN